jgi:Spy/CpxP family protein refolding chaperone
MKDRMRALAVLVAVFLLGGVIGASVFYYLPGKPQRYSTPGEGRNGSSIRIQEHQRLPNFLELTQEQQTQFREIMAESWKQLDALRIEQTPKIKAIQAETNRRLLEILNPEQQEKFKAFLEEMKNRRERSSRRRGPAPPQ